MVLGLVWELPWEVVRATTGGVPWTLTGCYGVVAGSIAPTTCGLATGAATIQTARASILVFAWPQGSNGRFTEEAIRKKFASGAGRRIFEGLVKRETMWKFYYNS